MAERPRLMVDMCMSGTMDWDSVPSVDVSEQTISGKVVKSYGVKCHWPHCDPRVLHSPGRCPTCAMFTEHQEERVRLDVSNTGEMNRSWICPADRDRPVTNQSWAGNRPEGYSRMLDLPDEDEV